MNSNLNNTDKISVIVPAYNVDSYIRKCLNSLIEQSFSNLEIIVINDGSTDNTAAVIAEFAQKDNRIKVITQKNFGLSKTRNIGIENATGEYIAFIDSDDWVDKDFFEKLYLAIQEENADIACANIIRYRGFSQKYRVKFEEKKVYTSLQDKIRVCRLPECCYVWNKLYKTSMIKKYKFTEKAYFEDMLWSPEVLKNSDKLVTVPEVNYFYRVNKNSIVKKKQSIKKQTDSYFAKKYIIKFFNQNNLILPNKYNSITKSIKYLFNVPVIKIKEQKHCETYWFMDFLPFYTKQLKSPEIKENTFIVWEPCSKSHSEVIPGYAKYLIELGYHVSVLLNPDRYKENLFARFKDKNISYNKMTKQEILDFFKRDSLENVKGVLVTTAGKLCNNIDIDDCYKTFNQNVDLSKLFFVFHNAKFAVDAGTWRKNLITLRKLNYKNASSVIINPHYFGEVKYTPKNEDVVNFVTVGAIQDKKKNNDLIINAVKELHLKGYRNFKVTVIGKGHLRKLPKELQQYFDIKGRLPFDKMYDELERGDFLLTSYSVNEPNHIFYNTSGTSGTFQLVYGFAKPCVIIESFGPMNGFDSSNSILYKADENFAEALIKGIEMSSDEYQKMQNNLKNYATKLYEESRNNFKNLIANGGLNV